MKLALIMSVAVILNFNLAAQSLDRRETEAVEKEQQKLEGAWGVVTGEIEDNTLTADQIAPDAELQLVFQGDRCFLRRRGEPGYLSECTYKVEPSSNPKTVDLAVLRARGDPKPFEGRKTMAICELNRDTLKACWTLFRAERGRATEFATKPDSGLLPVVYKREKAEPRSGAAVPEPHREQTAESPARTP